MRQRIAQMEAVRVDDGRSHRAVVTGEEQEVWAEPSPGTLAVLVRDCERVRRGAAWIAVLRTEVRMAHSRSRTLTSQSLKDPIGNRLSAARTLGRHQGNFPQAFTHLGFINAVLHAMGWSGGHHPRRTVACPRCEAGAQRHDHNTG